MSKHEKKSENYYSSSGDESPSETPAVSKRKEKSRKRSSKWIDPYQNPVAGTSSGSNAPTPPPRPAASSVPPPPPPPAKKHKHRIQPAASAQQLSSYELFGTDSEDEDAVHHRSSKAGRTREDSKTASASKKRSKSPHSSLPVPPPPPPPSPARNATARDLFGSDSDDDDCDELANPVQPSLSSRIMNNNENNEMIECEKCKITLKRNEYRYHLRTNLHKSNCLLNTEFDNINIIATAFRSRIITYRLNVVQEDEYLTPEAFLNNNQDQILKLIRISMNKHESIKINFELFAHYMLPKSDKQELKSFNSKYEVIYKSSDTEEFYTNTCNTLLKKMSEFEFCESGWSYLSMSHLEININKYSPLRGGSYIKLPKGVRNTKSCVNIKNKDNCCFLWSIIAELYPSQSNVCRTSPYPHYSTILNTKGMSFPPSQNDIKQFERNNPTISVNVYGLNSKCDVTGPLYMTTAKKSNHVNLLYIENRDQGHYCLIKNLMRLVKRQVSNHKGKMFFCEDCLQFFKSEKKFTSHNCSCVLTQLPEKNTILKFRNYEKQQKINFIIYADFESLLINCDDKKSKNTQMYQYHEPSCFGYYICCSHDSRLNKYVTYRGPDCVNMFIKCLIKDIKRINTILKHKMPMNSLTTQQEKQYQNASTCHICNDILFDDKVRDHDHITGMYRGAAHSRCNLIYRVCPFIPVVFHNLSGYDSHIFIRELAALPGSIKIIPKSKEKYLTITKEINLGKCSRPIQIKFIDSFQFLSASLDDLGKSLSKDDFIHLAQEFGLENIDLLKKKGVYPYDYMNSWAKYDEMKLPCKESFYNSLKLEVIDDLEYRHAQTIWTVFNIKNLGEYTDLYIKCDVLILCDIFENFRKTSLHYYKLDPAYYVTSPSLSWDAMLLYTGVKLELISDLQIYELLESGIRGGLAQCSLRHAKANNKYLSQFDDTKPSSYLINLDSNNLYGHSMARKLPVSDFKWLTKNEIDTFDVMSISDENNYGFILEVDLEYPDYVHDDHKDLPFAARKFVPPGGKNAKLIANLYDKYYYVIHYVHLKECLKNGLILRKIHRIISFRQDDYLKKYIDLNTSLRQTCQTAFEKDFFKLLNNSVFGKTIENKRKQVNVKLVTEWKDTNNVTNKHLEASKLIAKPNLKNITIFSENLVAIQLSHEKLVLDRPIYIGFTVLEYAKQHLYKFHYSYMKRKYKNNVQLCYTDTDSLLYLVFTEDFYKDMHDDISEFDTSNYPSNNPYDMPIVNCRIPGLFKDEMGGDVISEFIGLRAKLYCIKSVKNTIKKAKGISKSVTKRLKPSQYYEALSNDSMQRCKMNMIKSIKHILYSQQVHKQIFNRHDDKIQILPDQIHTVPWGHCNTIF